jgi:hypothetical protein
MGLAPVLVGLDRVRGRIISSVSDLHYTHVSVPVIVVRGAPIKAGVGDQLTSHPTLGHIKEGSPRWVTATRAATSVRSGAWLASKRRQLRASPQLGPAAAVLTVAGVLIGGAGTVSRAGVPEPAGTNDDPMYLTGGSHPTEGDCSAEVDRDHADAGTRTAASPRLPLGSEIRVTNPATGESVVVRVSTTNVDSSYLTLSPTAFGGISRLAGGIVDVHYEVLRQDAT